MVDSDAIELLNSCLSPRAPTPTHSSAAITDKQALAPGLRMVFHSHAHSMPTIRTTPAQDIETRLQIQSSVFI